MPTHDFQKNVAEFVNKRQLEASMEVRLIDLLSEMGEVAKEALKGSAYGKADFDQTPAWAEELGDVFFSLVCLANSTGVDLEKALEDVLVKYEMRLNERENAEPGG
jgi:NTP pyrophosphatase (non-canonical NTP hydrolase)